LLRTKDVAPTTTVEKTNPIAVTVNGIATAPTMPALPKFGAPDPAIGMAGGPDMERWQYNASDSPQNGGMEDFNFNAPRMDMGMDNAEATFTWEMVGLGLEEPLPPQETIDEL
jgi:hypothetical protein